MKVKLKDQKQFHRLLIKKGFSKNKLAKAAELSQPYVIQLCQGIRYPRPTTAQKILKALEVEFDDIFMIDDVEEEVSAK